MMMAIWMKKLKRKIEEIKGKIIESARESELAVEKSAKRKIKCLMLFEKASI